MYKIAAARTILLTRQSGSEFSLPNRLTCGVSLLSLGWTAVGSLVVSRSFPALSSVGVELGYDRQS